jgi:23S rRNA (uracil1939-C5)-methyltransferase
VDVETCLQLDEGLDRAIAAFRSVIGPHLEGTGELHALLGHAGGVHLAGEGDQGGGSPALYAAAKALVGMANIAGVEIWLGDDQITTGVDRIEVEPGQWSSAGDFAQASAAGNAELVVEMLRAVAPRPGLRILELFAGSGNFTRHLVAAGAEVVANDVIARDIPGARVEPGPAHRVVRAGFDVLLLDPPRTGAAEVIAAVIALGAAAPPRIVYVSCDAATLARDLDRLCEAGYVPRRAQVLDLFPQTAHLEIVALLER